MNLKEVKSKAAEYMADGFADPSKFNAKLGEFFGYAFENYESMDDEARAYIDRLQEEFIGMVVKGIQQLPDSPQRRTWMRLAASAKGKHLKAESLARSLSASPAYEFPIVQEAESVFFGVLQHILDVLHDATSESHHGVARFSAISLMYWVVDELLVAFHLAQRKYATQAYSHIRIVFENLDKVELFHKHPKWAQLWASKDTKAILRELKPSAVRQKLGKPKYDPVYSYFSEVGTHGTFRGVQDRVAKRVKASADNPATVGVSIWVGGIPRRDQLVMSISACVFTAVSSLVRAEEVFEDRLNSEETVQVLQSAIDQSTGFLRKHFVGWAQETKFDVTELVNHLQNKPPFK